MVTTRKAKDNTKTSASNIYFYYYGLQIYFLFFYFYLSNYKYLQIPTNTILFTNCELQISLYFYFIRWTRSWEEKANQRT